MRIRVRSLELADEQLTFAWRTDADTVANAVDPQAPTALEHRTWLRARMVDGDRRCRIVELHGVAIGTFTVTRRDDGAELGYCIAPAWRGGGLSRVVRQQAIDCIRAWWPAARVLRSQIRHGNEKSRRTALRMGARLARESAGFQHFETALAAAERAAA